MNKTTPTEVKKGNIHKFKFGKAINKSDIADYLKIVYVKKYKLTNVNFCGHYWWGDVTETATKRKAEKVRLDYFLSYERCPRALK